jgi:hypothetical protein
MQMCKTVLPGLEIEGAAPSTVGQLRTSAKLAGGEIATALDGAFPSLRASRNAAWCYSPLPPDPRYPGQAHWAVYAVATPLRPIHVTDNVTGPKGTPPTTAPVISRLQINSASTIR